MTSVVRQDFSDGQSVPVKHEKEAGQSLKAATPSHAIAFQGKKYNFDDYPVSKEKYDLIIVGAGLSGLSAAHFYRKKFGNEKKLLIVDTSEDFGGHAKRNEFHHNGQLFLSYGGSESVHAWHFTPVAQQLIKDLGIDFDLFDSKYFQHHHYPNQGLSRGSFFDGAHFGGKDVMVKGDPTDWVVDEIPRDRRNAVELKDFIEAFPLSRQSRDALLELFNNTTKVTLSDKTPAEREEYLSKRSYSTFLEKDWGVTPEVVAYYRTRALEFFGYSTDYLPALMVSHFGYPGFQGIADLPHDEEALLDMSKPYIYHFPDGNASIARLIVKSLIPEVGRGGAPEDIVTETLDYSKLDLPSNPTRLRLNASVVKAANIRTTPNGPATGVDVLVLDTRTNEVTRIQATQAMFTCFNMAIPYIVDGLSDVQSKALKQNIKCPLVYSNVLVRNWEPWIKLGVHDIFGVKSFHSRVKLDYPVNIGKYTCSPDPSKPAVVHMVHVPSVEGATDPASALRAARKTLFSNKFDVIEKHIREDLSKMLGAGGFDADKDILAITINRWSHGYSWFENTLSESATYEEDARKKFGNITIAGSDAGWSAYAHSAIDQGHRAVQEL